MHPLRARRLDPSPPSPGREVSEPYLTPEDIATELGVSRTHAHRLIKQMMHLRTGRLRRVNAVRYHDANTGPGKEFNKYQARIDLADAVLSQLAQQK
jgi:AraC-like DNA-binding protein